jgi:cytochrome P450
VTVADYDQIDLFRDPELPKDPYPFYEWVREQGPIWYYPLWDVWLVTGYDEVIAVYHDQKSWSN